MMDDDIPEDAELKKEVEAEVRKRKRAILKAQKLEEERMLIEAADGKVRVRHRIAVANFTYRA